MQQNLQRIIWLASFHKSGNTWMRAFLGNYFAPKGRRLTINQLNQFTTGDVRRDFFDAAAGGRFSGEMVEDSLAIRPAVQRLIAASKTGHHFVKTHSKIGEINGTSLISPEVTAAAIYIVRNPFDIVPSFSRHSGLTIDGMITAMADHNAVYRSEDGICEFVGRWDEHVDGWLTAPGLPRHLVRYEDMLADTEGAMKGVLEFLKVPVQRGQLRRALRASSFGELQRQERNQGFSERPERMETFFLTGSSGGWRAALTPAQVARIREAFLPALEQHYPELLDETAKFASAA